MVALNRVPSEDNAGLLYTPKPDANLAIDRLGAIIERKYATKFASYKDFHKWSVENYADFWSEVLDFTHVRLSEPYTSVVDTSKRIDEVPKWFVGARLNYAENCLLNGKDDKIALYFARKIQFFSTVRLMPQVGHHNV
uniref:Acetyl-coenzyme A synthetase N-terminal domain-containing protein n=1 Tax=Plectus sambesii TaxID=2011161 RepID=A0A914UJX7_9BILA